MSLLPIAEYIAVIRAIPGIVATLLSGHLGKLDSEQNRETLVTAADLALTQQVPGAAVLPGEFRKKVIRSVLDGLLNHVHKPV